MIFDQNDNNRKINQSTIQSYKVKVLKIEIKEGYLLTTLILEKKRKEILRENGF